MNKKTERLPARVGKGFRAYRAMVLTAALLAGCAVTAFAADDPLTVVGNLSTFIFGLIRAVGIILLGHRPGGLVHPEPRPQPAVQWLFDRGGRDRSDFLEGNSRFNHGIIMIIRVKSNFLRRVLTWTCLQGGGPFVG